MSTENSSSINAMFGLHISVTRSPVFRRLLWDGAMLDRAGSWTERAIGSRGQNGTTISLIAYPPSLAAATASEPSAP